MAKRKKDRFTEAEINKRVQRYIDIDNAKDRLVAAVRRHIRRLDKKGDADFGLVERAERALTRIENKPL